MHKMRGILAVAAIVVMIMHIVIAADSLNAAAP